MKVVVLIPAYNEAELITRTVEAARQIPAVSQVVVVNDGSTDATGELAEKAGALRVDMPRNSGKGAALRAGWQAVEGDVYLLLDADLGETAAQGNRLLEPILSGRADMTIARFTGTQAHSGRMGFGLARRLAAWAVRHWAGRVITCPLSGQRGVRAEVLERAGGFAEGFGVELALTLKALWAGFRVEEVEVAMRHRATGRGPRGFLHRGRQLLHIIGALRQCLKERDFV